MVVLAQVPSRRSLFLMCRAEELLCPAESLTALAAAEEAIAVEINTIDGPVTLSRATSPSATPRTH